MEAHRHMYYIVWMLNTTQKKVGKCYLQHGEGIVNQTDLLVVTQDLRIVL